MDFGLEDQELDDSTQLVRPSGELDLTTAPELKERLVELLDAGKRNLVIDLTRVDSVDSTALGALMSGQRRAQASGGTVTVINANDTVRKAFEITGLDRIFGMRAGDPRGES